MSRLIDDYENKGLRKLIHWVNADYPDVYKEETVPVKPVQAEKGHPFREKTQNWLEEKGRKAFPKIYRVLAALVCMTVILVLLNVVNLLPVFGDSSNPTNNEVYERYVEKAQEETGAVNSVCGVILNYRGFDTLNEAHVLFIATCAVMVLLRIDHRKDSITNKEYEAAENDRGYEPHNDRILQRSAYILVPFILLFGINIMLNGHLSPGGGFSGGAITGGGLILLLSAYGFKATQRFFNEHVYHIIKIGALCIYTVLMTYFIYMGANQLENGINLGTPGAILSSGIMLPINVVVGLEVACTIYGLFAFFRKGGL